MSDRSTDRNLLIGVLAVQMEFISRDNLIHAMNEWILDKSASLDVVLRKSNVIDDDTQRLLVGLVDKHISLHADDPAESLAAVSQTVRIPETLGEFADTELTNTLSRLPQHDVTLDALSTYAPAFSRGARERGSRFRILRAHSSGGLGTVSVACDEELGREVALKEIKESHADHPENRRRFMIEAEITGCLEHPGIVPVYGLGEYADGRPFYAMRFIRGESLQHAVERFHSKSELDRNPRQRELELQKLLRRLIDVCDAIEYAHSRGVLHRDLKPDNVMLGKYGETLVVDWGLAKAEDQIDISHQNEPPLRLLSGASATSTRMGECLGTPAYMSPEQASGRLDLMNATSDVYSLGATLYAILTGKPPVSGGTLESVLRRVRTGEFDKPRTRDPRISPSLEAVCLKSMELAPEDRYPTARELAEDLERWLADEPVLACVEPLPKRIARWSRQHRVLFSSLIAGSLASILILSVSLVFLLAANRRERVARDVADSERARAESNLTVAKQAVSTMLTEVGREELAQFPQMEQTRTRLLTKARNFYDQFLAQRPTDEALRFEWAIALRNLAEIDRLVDNSKQAEDRYLLSILELRDLVKLRPSKTIFRRQLASVLDDIGQLVKRRDASRAEAFFDEAIELQSALSKTESDSELQQQLARSLYNRGLARSEQGNRDEARNDVSSAIEIFQNILRTSSSPDPSVAQELARCYNNLANIAKSMGDRTTARSQFAKAIELLEEQVKATPSNRDLVNELAIYENNFANLLRAEGDLELSDRTSEQAITKLVSLAQPLPALANDLANAHHNRGVILSQREMTQEAETEYQQARAILIRLTTDFPDVPLYRDRLGNTLFQLGTMRFQAGNPNEAIPLVREAMQKHQSALQQSTRDPSYRQHLKNDFVGLCLICIAAKDHATAFKTCLDFADEFSDDGAAQFDAAQLIARCIPVVQDNKVEVPVGVTNELVSSYKSRIRDVLQSAKVAGFRDSEKVNNALLESGAFFSLRNDPKITELLDQLRISDQSSL